MDHNNGLEGTNNDIKRTKVFRDKQKLGSFLHNAVEIVEGWSKQDDTRLYCDKSELVSLENQTNGYQWLMKNQSPSSIIKLRGKYYTLSSSAPDELDLKDAVKFLLKTKKTWIMMVDLMNGRK